MKGLARQLGHPQGLRGRLVVRMLNRANRVAMTDAVSALAPRPGATVADVGFGGGLGLDLLLDAVGPEGQVVGIDRSRTVIDRTTRARRHHIADGRLTLHLASMLQLPLADGALDGALTVNTVYFVEELDRALAELARVTATSGRVVIGLGDPDAMARERVVQHGFRLRPVAEVVEMVTGAGFHLEDHRRTAAGKDAMHLLVLHA
jgi:SAM-dependent methyltransferase